MIEGILEVHIDGRAIVKMYPPKGEVDPDKVIDRHVICCTVGYCSVCKRNNIYQLLPFIDGESSPR